MLSLPAAVIGGWRAHFRRNPPDAVEALLSILIRMQAAEPQPLDCDVRPWRYTADQAAALRARAEDEVESARQEESDRSLTAFNAAMG